MNFKRKVGSGSSVQTFSRTDDPRFFLTHYEMISLHKTTTTKPSKQNFFQKDFIYSWETPRERQRHRQREKQAPYGEPNMGLDPWTPGPQPEPKSDTQPLSHPGTPKIYLFEREQDSMSRATWVVQWLTLCLWLRAWSRGPGIKSHIGLPAGSLLLPLPMSLPRSLMNK